MAPELKDVDGIDAAALWVGSTLLVAETALVSLGPGEYYHYQVVGFEVFSVTGERVGVISATLSTPGGELYVVQGTGQRTSDSRCQRIDRQGRFHRRQSDYRSTRRLIGPLIVALFDR